MRLMALDIGERRIGIAISESGVLATPHSVLQRQSKKEDFNRLARLVDQLKIERVIIGLPYSLSGAESYSTMEAAHYLAATGRKKIPIDAAAAAVILQNYLDSTGHRP